VPECLSTETATILEYSDKSMFWVTNRIAQFAYLRYDYIGAEVRSVIDEWENKMLVEVLAEDEVLSNKKTDKMKKLATKWSVENAQALWQKWSNLDDYLMVKYIDGNIKKQAEDGSFLTNGHSPAQPASPSQPGYSEKFLRAIAADHGEVLKVVK
ncbi:MAG: dipeptidase, partial [Tidjanibacter sp.]|nr:dipeptidase [Tidjanibacter sp.]